MYEQIARNKRASVVLCLAMAIVLLGLGLIIGLVWSPTGISRAGVLLFFAILAVIWSLVAFYRGASLILAVSAAHEVDETRQPRLWHVVEEISIAAGVPLPKIYVIDDAAPNALATGRDPRHAAVAVTTGLLAIMNRRELQAVLAHEIAHVRNYDVRLDTVVCALVNVSAKTGNFFVRLSSLAFRLAASLGATSSQQAKRQKNESRVSAVALLLALLLAVPSLLSATAARLAYGSSRLVQLAISRQREYLADASAVELSRDPLALAQALEKIAAYPGELGTANVATAHLFIANPFRNFESWRTRLFDTHPPIEKRIAVLRAIGHEQIAGEAR
jgi:heat shock protein HtpX